MNVDPPFIERELRGALAGHDQLVLHTVGDASWRFVLDAMGRLAPPERWKPPPLVSSIRRSLATISDTPWRWEWLTAQPRFDSVPLRTMLDGGMVVAYGSDEGSFPPFVALRLMISSAKKAQAITREEAMGCSPVLAHGLSSPRTTGAG